MEKKFNFVYVTTNLINGKQYVGDHSVNNLEKDKYLGSGKYFCNAINKYGKDKFKRKILEFFPTKKESSNAQEKYIKEYNTLSPNGYNISPKGGHQFINSISIETRIKLSVASKGKKLSEQHKENISKGNIGKIHSEETKKLIVNTRQKNNSYVVSEETKNKISKTLMGKISPKKGKKFEPLSKEHKMKISKRLQGIKRSEETKQKMKNHIFSKEHKLHLKESCKHRKNISEETRNRQSESHKGKQQKRKTCPHCNKNIAVNIYARCHGDKCKNIV